jgi:hypothetical protein
MPFNHFPFRKTPETIMKKELAQLVLILVLVLGLSEPAPGIIYVERATTSAPTSFFLLTSGVTITNGVITINNPSAGSYRIRSDSANTANDPFADDISQIKFAGASTASRINLIIGNGTTVLDGSTMAAGCRHLGTGTGPAIDVGGNTNVVVSAQLGGNLTGSVSVNNVHFLQAGGAIEGAIDQSGAVGDIFDMTVIADQTVSGKITANRGNIALVRSVQGDVTGGVEALSGTIALLEAPLGDVHGTIFATGKNISTVTNALAIDTISAGGSIGISDASRAVIATGDHPTNDTILATNTNNDIGLIEAGTIYADIYTPYPTVERPGARGDVRQIVTTGIPIK